MGLARLAVPFKLMVSLGVDGPNVNIDIVEKLNKIKREKCFQQLVKCPPSCLIYICHNGSGELWRSMD